MKRVELAEVVHAFRPRGGHGPSVEQRRLRRRVQSILDAVYREGEPAVVRWNRRFDPLASDALEVPARTLRRALDQLGRVERARLESAAARIRRFAQAQLATLRPLTLREPGLALGHRIRPLERVGAYVPGGRFPLMSTALMTVIPAKVAGVPEVVVCSPTRDGEIPSEVLAAASLAGADRVLRTGGAQAIALLAYGGAPEGIGLEPVHRIVGPGNAYVACAKQLVSESGATSIDMTAGPSELLVLALRGGSAERAAANLLAQAEHDPDAVLALIGLDEPFLERCNVELRRQLDQLPDPSRGIAKSSLARSVAAVARDVDELVQTSNAAGAEHLWVDGRGAAALERRLTCYGSLFIGQYSDVALGDYLTGPNHTLPTQGSARWRGGLWTGDFVRVQTFQRVGRAARGRLAPVARALAEAEGLTAHARSLE